MHACISKKQVTDSKLKQEKHSQFLSPGVCQQMLSWISSGMSLWHPKQGVTTYIYDRSTKKYQKCFESPVLFGSMRHRWHLWGFDEAHRFECFEASNDEKIVSRSPVPGLPLPKISKNKHAQLWVLGWGCEHATWWSSSNIHIEPKSFWSD